MSVQVALDNIWLRPCERWGHTEYSMNYHKEYCRRLTGMEAGDPGFGRALNDALQIDFQFGTNDGMVNWAAEGRVTDMGHAVYAADGSDQRQAHESPFKTPEEVWAFDAVEEYGLPDFDEQVRVYEQSVQNSRENLPGVLCTGGYYRTIVSGGIASFGWDMLLLAASDPVKLEPVLDSFFRRTLFHMKAWAQTTVDVVIQHDDFVWTSGPFMHPDIYRSVILPRYAELWKPIHEAGKKVLFCSDGDFTVFVDDLAEAGADGFIFEPVVDFGMMADKFAKTHCLVGSFVDCRDLTFERWDVVRADIDRTFERLQECAGAIVAVGNHLPPNIPGHMLDKYYDYLLPKLIK